MAVCNGMGNEVNLKPSRRDAPPLEKTAGNMIEMDHWIHWPGSLRFDGVYECGAAQCSEVSNIRVQESP